MGTRTDPQSSSSWLPRFNLRDVLNARDHSADFRGSRAEYIHQRVRSLGLVLALLMVLWIPIDYLAVAPGEFLGLAGARLLAASLLLLISLRRKALQRLRSALFQLAALMLIIVLFYASTRIAIDGQADYGFVIGYDFFPFVLIALQAVFPLALLEGVLLALPVLGSVIGVKLFTGQLLTVETLSDLWLLALLVGIAWWAQVAQLDMLMRLYRQASRDPLTNLFNRRVLMERLIDEFRRSRRYDRELAVMMIDLDRFKRINDRRGHLTGDAVLRKFAETLLTQLRNVDLVGRYGGEEFLVVLPETGIDGGLDVADRIRLACRNNPAVSGDGNVVAYTVSIGLTICIDGDSFESLIERADRALYRAKRAGRDRVMVLTDNDWKTDEMPVIESVP